MACSARGIVNFPLSILVSCKIDSQMPIFRGPFRLPVIYSVRNLVQLLFLCKPHVYCLFQIKIHVPIFTPSANLMKSMLSVYTVDVPCGFCCELCKQSSVNLYKLKMKVVPVLTLVALWK